MALVPIQGEGLVLAVPLTVAVFDPDSIVASHVPTRQLAGGNSLIVVVHSALWPRYDIRPAARVVIEPMYLDPVLLQFNKVATVYLDLVTFPPMHKADLKLQFPSAIVCRIPISQPELAAIAADAGAVVYLGWRGHWRGRDRRRSWRDRRGRDVRSHRDQIRVLHIYQGRENPTCLAAEAAELIPGVFHISPADIELRPSGDGADDAERGARSRAHVDVSRGQVRLDRKAGRGWHGRIGGPRRIGSLRSLWLRSRRRGLLNSAVAARLLRGRRRPPAST